MSGRGKKVKADKQEKPKEPSAQEEEQLVRIEPKPEFKSETNHKRTKPPSVDDLYKVIRSTSNKIEILIDNLDENDEQATLKRNVAVALKHLKAMHTQLAVYCD